jgi:hypothetical protein
MLITVRFKRKCKLTISAMRKADKGSESPDASRFPSRLVSTRKSKHLRRFFDLAEFAANPNIKQINWKIKASINLNFNISL